MPGVSTLITSAPISASTPVQNGPARMRVRSTARIPDNGTIYLIGCHCERSEAISCRFALLQRDCFATPLLATTMDGMNRTITSDDIEALAVGAWILGTGGGGSPHLGLLNMRL